MLAIKIGNEVSILIVFIFYGFPILPITSFANKCIIPILPKKFVDKTCILAVLAKLVLAKCD